MAKTRTPSGANVAPKNSTTTRPSPLGSSLRTDEELVELGRRHSVAHLQAIAAAFLSGALEPSLEEVGFNGAWRQALGAEVDALVELDARLDGKLGGRPEAEARKGAYSAALRWYREARAVVVLACLPGIRLAPAGQRPGRSLVGLVRTAATVLGSRPALAALRAPADGERLATALEEALDAEAALDADIEPLRHDLQLQKGRVYAELSRFSRAARVLVRGRGDRFNLQGAQGRRRGKGRRPEAAVDEASAGLPVLSS